MIALDASLEEEPVLKGVSRTLLIPLYARAHAAELLPSAAFDDAASRAVLVRLGVRPGQLSREAFPMRLCIARSRAVESALSALLPGPGLSTVAKRIFVLGCGLDTLPQRLREFDVDWVCADLPEVIALRDRLLPASGRVSHAVARLPNELSGIARLLAQAVRPVILLEGVLPYLAAETVASSLRQLVLACPHGADLFVDAYHPALLAFSRIGDTFRRMDVVFRFGVRDAADYAAMAPRLRVASVADVLRPIPRRQRLLCLPPALLAAGSPLASIVHLEILPR